MSDGFAFLDILFFAMVAAVIAYRLRSVLGRRTGNERRRDGSDGSFGAPEPQKAENAEKPDNVVPLPERHQQDVLGTARDGDLKAGLTQIRLSDRGFEPDSFLSGARAAFEMIVEAFARGDKDALRPLLADDVYHRFARAIDERTSQGHQLETNVVSVDRAEIVEAGMIGARARVTVRFVSQQVNVVRDQNGEIIEGDPTRMDEIIDLWTFERDTSSVDPNWQLVKTRTE